MQQKISSFTLFSLNQEGADQKWKTCRRDQKKQKELESETLRYGVKSGQHHWGIFR